MIDFIFGCKPSHFLSSRIEVRGEIIWAYPQQLLNHQKKLYWWLIESSIISVGSNDLKRSKSCCRVGGLLTREAGGILFWHEGGGKCTNEVRRQNYCKKNVKNIINWHFTHFPCPHPTSGSPPFIRFSGKYLRLYFFIFSLPGKRKESCNITVCPS